MIAILWRGLRIQQALAPAATDLDYRRGPYLWLVRRSKGGRAPPGMHALNLVHLRAYLPPLRP